eukprot:12403139-Karenia_brevis.AAC.1
MPLSSDHVSFLEGSSKFGWLSYIEAYNTGDRFKAAGKDQKFIDEWSEQMAIMLIHGEFSAAQLHQFGIDWMQRGDHALNPTTVGRCYLKYPESAENLQKFEETIHAMDVHDLASSDIQWKPRNS